MKGGCFLTYHLFFDTLEIMIAVTFYVVFFEL